MMRNLKTVLEQALRVVEDVGVFIRQEAHQFQQDHIETKALNSLVTYVDKTAEKMLVERLNHILPEAGFWTEEETAIREEKTFTWIIDPLDGTTNFIHHVPVYGISVGLKKEQELLLGIIYEVNSKELFYAQKQSGAFLNHQKIKVSTTRLLSDALIASGFPYNDHTYLAPYLQSFEHFVRHARGVRRLGSAAVDLAYIACGRFDGYFEYGLNPWDVAAGILLVREAGGVVQDFQGLPDVLSGQQVLASNEALSLRLLNITKQFFYPEFSSNF